MKNVKDIFEKKKKTGNISLGQGQDFEETSAHHSPEIS